MYSKGLIPGHAGGPAVPLVIATAPENASTIRDLHAAGWSQYGGNAKAPGAQLSITDTFKLIVHDEVLLSDTVNPAGPPGWWDAVSTYGDRAVVVVVEFGHIDLRSPSVGAQLKALLDTDHAAQSLVPVTHG